jgi:hypothetical protein
MVDVKRVVKRNVMTSKDLTRSRPIGEGKSGVLQYQYTGVDPATGKDRPEMIMYNRDKTVVGRNDLTARR